MGSAPLSPTGKSNRGGGGSGRVKSPSGAASRTIVPGSSPLTRWEDSSPSGIARTVIAMVRPFCLVGELTE